MTATLHADADVMRLIGDLRAAGRAEVNGNVLVLHVDPYQADDLLDASELDRSHTSLGGHRVHRAWLLGWAEIRIVVDRDPAAILADLPADVGGFPCGGREAT